MVFFTATLLIQLYVRGGILITGSKQSNGRNISQLRKFKAIQLV